MPLEVESLVKRFGSRTALDSMSFTVHPGELYGFVGSNGAGKTTAMRIILGVLDADSGEVLLDGDPLTFERRQRFGYMPEERGLYQRMKVGEQLIYLARLHGLTKEEATHGMEYWTERLGIAGRRNDELQALSLGNQQRVQLSAALIHNPDVLILDEPFSGLDPLAVEDMSGALRQKANDGATVVFSSHQLDLVERICDRVGIASLGKIVAEGSIGELRATKQPLVDIVTGADLHVLIARLNERGVQTRQVGENAVRATLPPTVSDQEVLAIAVDCGPVHTFSPYRPHLTELFSHVVATPNNDEPDETGETQDKPRRPGLLRRN